MKEYTYLVSNKDNHRRLKEYHLKLALEAYTNGIVLDEDDARVLQETLKNAHDLICWYIDQIYHRPGEAGKAELETIEQTKRAYDILQEAIEDMKCRKWRMAANRS